MRQEVRQCSRARFSLRSQITLAALGSSLFGLPHPNVQATKKGLLVGVKSPKASWQLSIWSLWDLPFSFKNDSSLSSMFQKYCLKKKIFRQKWEAPLFLFCCFYKSRRRRYILSSPTGKTAAEKEIVKGLGDRRTRWKPQAFLEVPSISVLKGKDHRATVLQGRVWK